MKNKRKFSNKIIWVITILSLLLTVIIASPSEPSQEQDVATEYLNHEPRSIIHEHNNSTPYLAIEQWVTPTQIYQQDDPGTPDFATVTLEIKGKGKPHNESEGPKAADIVFVVDTTGSMGNNLQQIQYKIEEIVKDINANITDVQFGLASYRDHPGYYSGCGYAANYGQSYDWIFKIEQELTTDTNAFKNKVNALYDGGGSDGKTSALDAIYNTTHNFYWRGGNVMKIALLIGDGVTHDCDNDYGEWGNYSSTGKCPNNHTMVDVVADTAENNVIWISIGIEDTEEINETGWAQWNYLTNGTGGVYRALGYDDIAEVILELLGIIWDNINAAGKKAVVTMVKPDYIKIVENTIIPKPTSIDNSRVYRWSLGTVAINETEKITFDIQSTEAGYDKLVMLYPETNLKYLALNGSVFNIPTTLSFNKTYIDILNKASGNINPPTSVILQPVQNRFYNSLTNISGTAFDNKYGYNLENVEISIKRLSDDHFWSGTHWHAKESWLLTSGTLIWDFDSSAVVWRSGEQYIVYSRATDKTSNIEVPGNGIIFNIDKVPPVSTITIPSHSAFLNNLDTITGTSKDFDRSGVDTVEICIKQTYGDIYWDGSAWLALETWLDVVGTKEWYFEANDVRWVTDTYYTIFSRATDNAQNVEHPGIGNTFMYDDKIPELSIYIDNNNSYTNSINVEISLFAHDSGSGVSLMACSSDNITYTLWEPFNSTALFNLPQGDGEKYVYFIVNDRAGNIGEPAFDSIILDTTPPENLSIIINDDDKYTKSNIIRLNLYAVDTLSGISNMSLSYDGNNWFNKESYKIMKTISLTTVAGEGINNNIDGEKTVYFRVRDHAGNIAEPVFDTIILDTTPPYSLSILINNGSPETNSTEVLLDLTALDAMSGVHMMKFSYDGINWSSWENYSQKRIFDLPPNDGEKTVFFNVKDYVGNIADPVSASIVLNTTKPEPTTIVEEIPVKTTVKTELWIIILIITICIFVIIVVTWFLRHKKRKARVNPAPSDNSNAK